MKIENDNSQLTIEMPKRTALDREDFLVNARNKAAVEFIDSFYKEPMKLGILIGPKGCGKTHLVNVLCKSLKGINWSFFKPKVLSARSPIGSSLAFLAISMSDIY